MYVCKTDFDLDYWTWKVYILVAQRLSGSPVELNAEAFLLFLFSGSVTSVYRTLVYIVNVYYMLLVNY